MKAAGSILATGKRVVIIGGGDTGADCLGTSHRQGARSVHQFEIMPKPPEERAASTPWPLWPLQLRTESSHEEGGIRDWSINTVKFTGDANGNVKQLHAIRVGPPPKFEPIAGTEFTLDVDLVLLAMGFLGPVRNGMIEELGLTLDARGNIATTELHEFRRWRLRRRGHAPRPVARGLGHHRRPQSRRRRQRVPGSARRTAVARAPLRGRQLAIEPCSQSVAPVSRPGPQEMVFLSWVVDLLSCGRPARAPRLV